MLIGRADDIGALEAALGATPRAAVVLGPAGIGKTSVVDAVTASHAGQVLMTTGVPGGHRIPLRDVLLLLGAVPQARSAVRDTLRQLQEGDQSTPTLALTELGYELGELVPPDALLVLDDAQWFGEESMTTLAALLAATRCPVLVASRDEDSLAQLVAARPGTRRLLLSPLGGDAVSQMLDGLGYARERRSVIVASGGIPLLVELLALGEGDVPPSGDVLATITRRLLDGLDQDERAVLDAVAVCGESGSWSMVATVAGRDLGTTRLVTARLAAKELVDAGPQPRVRHPALREMVVREMPSARIGLTADRAARHLHGIGAPAAEIALHLTAAGTIGETWAADVWLETARQHRATGSHDAAAEAVRHGLAEPPGPARAPLLGLRCWLESDAGDLAAAEDTLRSIGRLEDAETYAAARAAVTAAALRDLDLDLLARLPSEPQAPPPSSTRAQALALYTELGSAWRRESHPALVARLRECPEIISTPGVSLAIAGCGSWIALCEGDTDLADSLLDIVVAAQATEGDLGAQNIGPAALACWMLDRDDDARSLLARGRELGRSWGPSTGLLRSTRLFEAAMALSDGYAAHAESLLHDEIHVDEVLVPVMRPVEPALALRLALAHGDDRAATSLVQETIDSVVEQDPPGPAVAHAVAAVLEAALVLPTVDLRIPVSDLLETGRALGRRGGRFAPLDLLAVRHAHHVGDMDDAAASMAAQQVGDVALAAVERAECLAVAARLEPCVADAMDLARRARDLLDEDRTPGPALRVDLTMARSLHRERQESAARALAARVARSARALGLVRLADEAELLVRLTGGRVRASAAPFGLTPAEERVMNELAEGRSTVEIAHRLSLSPRTVEAHLRAIYRKLAVSDRAQARRAWARSADLPLSSPSAPGGR